MRLFTFVCLFWMCLGLAWADCSGPTASAGKIIYNSTYHVMQFCDGTDWRNTGAVIGSAPQTGCANPSGTAGKVIYNSDAGVVQFCNGSQWVDTACAEERQTDGSGCASPVGNAGQIIYESTSHELQFCDSTHWVAMGYPCGGGAASGGAPACPTGFAFIPGSADIDGQPTGWCVSRYEMTPDDTSEWTGYLDREDYWIFGDTDSAASKYVAAKSFQGPLVSVTHDQAALACSSYLKDGDGQVLSGGKLMTLPLWRALVLDVTNVPDNWSGGAVGSGYMSRGKSQGYSTSPKSTGEDVFPTTVNMIAPSGEYWSRTYKTSYGELIWDLAGNAAEMFLELHGGDYYASFHEFTEGDFSYLGVGLNPPNSSWTTAQGVGGIRADHPVSSGSWGVAIYGGDYSDREEAGVWSTSWSKENPSGGFEDSIGFRCVVPAP